MLVLSRKKEEAIVIGANIQVTVLEIKGNRVRLGIKAPDDVAVDRAEVHQRIQEFCSVDELLGYEREAVPLGCSTAMALSH